MRATKRVQPEPETKGEVLLTAAEVGRRLSLRPWAVYKLLGDGVLGTPVHLGGRTLRIPESVLNAFIAQGGSRTRPRAEAE